MVQITQQRVVLDACVLFPAALRDTLLLAAEVPLYHPCLTDEIVEEARRNLVNKRKSSETQAQKLVLSLNNAFREYFVKDYQPLIPLMPINEKDRHVLAAAITSQSHVIVTHNLKDFPANSLVPYNIEAWSPDQFLLQLLSDNPDKMKVLLLEQATLLRNPPMTVSQILDQLALNAPKFAQLFRQIFAG